MRDKILKTIETSDGIPTPPVVALDLMKLALNEDVSMKRLAEKISHDVSLSAKILRLVNSAFYGFGNKINSVQQAIVILGAESVRNLILGISVIDTFPGKSATALYNQLIEAGLASAVAARKISGKVAPQIKEDAFVAGLLQNIGMLVMLYRFPKEYSAVYREAAENGVELLTVEDEMLRINHIEVGSILIKKWQLPENIAIPVSKHHCTSPDDLSGLPARQKLLCLTAILGGLVGDIYYGWNKSGKIGQFKKLLKSAFNTSDEEATQLLSSIDSDISAAAAGFQIKVQQPPDFNRILNAANTELGKLNLKYDTLYREMRGMVAELKQKNEELDRLSREVLDKNKQLRELADKDGLTKCYNHRFFKNYLAHQIFQYQRNKVSLALVMLDIDHFKNVNDTFGHQAGDSVLKKLANILNRSARQSDLVARYGGEEFAIVLNATDLNGAAIFAEKLRRKIESAEFSWNNQLIPVTSSFGVAVIMPDMATADKLIELADTMLYHSKENGRNRISVPHLNINTTNNS